MTVSNGRGQKSKIARELGISGAAVGKLAARGMPIDNADAARRWRAANLNQLRARPDPGPSAETLVQRAQSLAELASTAMANHRLDLVRDELREALRAVPDSHRAQVSMSVDLWKALIGAYALRVLDEGPRQPPEEPLSDEDAEFVGGVCYSLACAEARIT